MDEKKVRKEIMWQYELLNRLDVMRQYRDWIKEDKSYEGDYDGFLNRYYNDCEGEKEAIGDEIVQIIENQISETLSDGIFIDRNEPIELSEIVSQSIEDLKEELNID